MKLRWLAVLMLLLATQAGAALCPDKPPRSATSWPAWEGFRGRFMSVDGRVIDKSVPQHQTTSEGQAYAMFFALVANDRGGFARLLRWTEDNLAQGDLAAHLPAWQWGRNKEGSWGVIDGNAASDADLWMAYALGEAGRLWAEPRYTALSQALAARVLDEETAVIPELGLVLLPGPRGFTPRPGAYRLNPSYSPIQLMRRLAALHAQAAWTQIASTSLVLIVQSAPQGYAPDWVLHQDGSLVADAQTQGVGSYDAIRVYLWTGLMHEDEPARTVLLGALAPMARQTAGEGVPPLRVDTVNGTASGSGPAGFSAAMLPFLAVSNLPAAERVQRQRLAAERPLMCQGNYYDQVLTLFGLGWAEGQYRFARGGALIPKWSCSAN